MPWVRAKRWQKGRRPPASNVPWKRKHVLVVGLDFFLWVSAGEEGFLFRSTVLDRDLLRCGHHQKSIGKRKEGREKREGVAVVRREGEGGRGGDDNRGEEGEE